MKTTDKNEMELLLRALGRSASAHSTGASAPQSKHEIGAHLDADELNCYAEGIVSRAEHARYTKHLADCDRCRRLVVGLGPVAGVNHLYDPLEQKTGWSLREKLKALFAPSVVRYAVPALALTTIIAVAIVALRQRPNTEFVAQNQTHTLPEVSSRGQDQQLNTNNGPQSAVSPLQQSKTLSGAKEKDLSQKSDAVQAPAAAPDSSARNDRTANGFLQPGQSAGVAQSQPIFAPEPTGAAAPPPPPRPALSDADKMTEARKEKAELDMQKRDREENKSQPQDENEIARTAGTKTTSGRGSSQRVGGLTVLSRSAKKDDKAAANAVEARRVSGRLFHRQGNAWVDADYVSGRATVNVSRGSEQFRALIADEPAIRSIAEQLGGEVIVVWKGTAYRIR
jgi:hypothetical protein